MCMGVSIYAFKYVCVCSARLQRTSPEDSYHSSILFCPNITHLLGAIPVVEIVSRFVDLK